jgi:hypothetical protein
MDETLLQSREGGPRQVPPGTNNGPVEPPNDLTEPMPDEQIKDYEDLLVEPAAPPLRLRFKPPFEYDGQTYGELIFDFDGLIGKDFQRAERTFNKLYKAEKNEVVLPEMKHLYHCVLAAQVADVPLGLIMKLPRRYYTPFRLRVLKACGSSPEEESQ